jgi:hypothetical protein
MAGCSQPKLGADKQVDMSKVMIQDIVIDEDELFQREFKDLFINIDLYNQLSKQGIKMTIQGDIEKGLDKEIKRVMKGKSVKIINKGVQTTKSF